MARRNRRNRKSKKAANKTASQKPSVDVAEKKNTDKAQDEVVECKAVAVIDSEAATEDTTTEETAAYSEASQRVAAAFEKVGQLISEPEPEPQPETQSVPSEVSDWQQVLESSLRDSNRKLQDQFTKVTKSFESRIEFLLDELADRSAAAKADQTESDTTTEPTAANGSVVESDWQRRKREMFAESGE